MFTNDARLYERMGSRPASQNDPQVHFTMHQGKRVDQLRKYYKKLSPVDQIMVPISNETVPMLPTRPDTYLVRYLRELHRPVLSLQLCF